MRDPANAHGVTMNDSAVFRRAIQALRIPEGKRPILIATMGSFGNPTSVENMRLLSAKMYDARWAEIDSSGSYTLNPGGLTGENISDADGHAVEFTDAQGNVFLMQPKNRTKSETNQAALKHHERIGK